MPSIMLEHLVGEILEQRFQIVELLRSEPQRVLFRGVDHYDPTEPRDVLVIVDLSDNVNDHFKRFLEARFLSHPNLLTVSSAGWVEVFGHSRPWIATHLPTSVLADRLMSHSPHSQEALGYTDRIQALQEIVQGLVYLHSENLAYCALRPDSVWRVGAKWVLSDFSQLRVIGSQPANDTDQELARRELAGPPEVLKGEVTPAWDVWSLGVLCGKLVGEPLPGHRALNAPAFEALLEKSVAPDPRRRPSLERMLAALAEIHPSRPESSQPPSNTVVAATEDFPREPAPAPRLRARAELLPESTLAKKSTRSPWWRIFIGVMVVSMAFLTALAVGRAVSGRNFGDLSPSAKPAVPRPGPDSLVPPSKSLTAPSDENSPLKKSIALALREWSAATRNRNVQSLVLCYAPVVDNYFNRRRISRAKLMEEKQSSLSRLGPIERFDISDISYEHWGRNTATVSFKKTWIFGGSNPSFGADREQMTFKRFNSDWKITTERQVKIY